MLLAMSGGVHAEMTVSQSNDPTATLDMTIAALLGQEKAGMGAVDASRLQKILTPPAPQATAARRKAKAIAAPTYDNAWLAALPAEAPGADGACLAQALYFEARGEGIRGQVAVAEVILNRVDDPSYPRTVCGVVQQSGGGGCQFSYVCDGRSDAIREKAAFAVSERIAGAMLEGTPRLLTEGATHFHTPKVHPSWAKRFALTAKIGSHIFYRAPQRVAMN